jgi:hypothetical protein
MYFFVFKLKNPYFYERMFLKVLDCKYPSIMKCRLVWKSVSLFIKEKLKDIFLLLCKHKQFYCYFSLILSKTNLQSGIDELRELKIDKKPVVIKIPFSEQKIVKNSIIKS